MSEAQVGEIVANRYRLDAAIGEGGMGKVYRATDLTLSRTVAIKILLPQYAVQERSRKRFTREAKVTAALSHPGAIRIYDFGTEDDKLYLVMELLNGETLRSRIARKMALSAQDAIEICYQIADVLVAAHQLSLIHRDLKPENIMVDEIPNGLDVTVLDFGMAFIADDESTEKGMGRLTKDGLAGGTPTYMSPEQVQGTTVTTQADVYALGCVLFEMLAGQPPFDGPLMKILTKQMYQPAPDVRRLAPETPQALVELVGRMLRKQPLDRPSAKTIRTRLAALGPEIRTERERSRDLTFLSTREARMVSAPTIMREETASPPASLKLVVVASASTNLDDISLALAASGISVIEHIDPAEFDITRAIDADVVYLAEPGDLNIGVVCKSIGHPVVVATGSVDIEVVSRLLRAGVTEVVTIPVAPDELTKKVRRAARKR